MKVIVDTNVLISGLISPNNPPAKIVDLWLSNKITVFVTPEIIEEYLAVLLRPKFKQLGTVQERYKLVSNLVELENTKVVNPDYTISVIKDDPDDNMFLACAVEGGAKVITSGDDHLLSLKKFEGVSIVPPSEFLQRYF